MILWSSQGAVENFHNTGLLHASVQSIAADMPGVSIRRQGYVDDVFGEFSQRINVSGIFFLKDRYCTLYSSIVSYNHMNLDIEC